MRLPTRPALAASVAGYATAATAQSKRSSPGRKPKSSRRRAISRSSRSSVRPETFDRRRVDVLPGGVVRGGEQRKDGDQTDPERQQPDDRQRQRDESEQKQRCRVEREPAQACCERTQKTRALKKRGRWNEDERQRRQHASTDYGKRQARRHARVVRLGEQVHPSERVGEPELDGGDKQRRNDDRSQRG